jgi:hypothetical protein
LDNCKLAAIKIALDNSPSGDEQRGGDSSEDSDGSGYYVYLVEKSPGVGGAMSQIDKTFPTNNCLFSNLGVFVV